MRNRTEAYFNGEWVNNIRHGPGELGLKNGNVIKGEFVNNKPQGECTIQYKDNTLFVGTLDRGIVQGKGRLFTPELSFEYEFVDGKRNGDGVRYVDIAKYELFIPPLVIVEPVIEEPVEVIEEPVKKGAKAAPAKAPAKPPARK